MYYFLTAYIDSPLIPQPTASYNQTPESQCCHISVIVHFRLILCSLQSHSCHSAFRKELYLFISLYPCRLHQVISSSIQQASQNDSMSAVLPPSPTQQMPNSYYNFDGICYYHNSAIIINFIFVTANKTTRPSDRPTNRQTDKRTDRLNLLIKLNPYLSFVAFIILDVFFFAYQKRLVGCFLFFCSCCCSWILAGFLFMKSPSDTKK